MRRLIKDPLLHFLVLGALIFGIGEVLGPSGEEGPTPTVEVGANQLERLAEVWQRQWHRPPTSAELGGLVEQYVRETIYYREALALGLDRDDTVVRRRMAQKLEFLSEDLAAVQEPNEAELQRFYDEHRKAYQEPSRVTFRHIYFSTDRRGDRAQADALETLTELRAAGEVPPERTEVGDPFMLPGQCAGLALPDVERQFGAGFAAALATLPIGEWQGPIPSAYGLHLVRLEEFSEARQPELGAVREAVARDFVERRQAEANQAFYRELRKRYRVIVDERALAAAVLPDVVHVTKVTSQGASEPTL